MRLAILAFALILVVGGALILSLGSDTGAPDVPPPLETAAAGDSSPPSFTAQQMLTWYDAFAALSSQIGAVDDGSQDPRRG